jgi:hypothetical protein
MAVWIGLLAALMGLLTIAIALYAGAKSRK